MNSSISNTRETSATHFRKAFRYSNSVFVAYDIIASETATNDTRSVGNYMVFCLCTNGSATIMVNEHKRTFTKGAQLIIIPNTRITLLSNSDDFECSFVSISPEFKQEGHFLSSISLIDALLFLKEQTIMYLTEPQQDFFIKLRDLLVLTIQTTLEAHKKALLMELVRSFFMWEQTTIAVAINASPITKNPQEIMAMRFLGLVNDHFRTEHRLAFYADRMSITAKYLSAIIKSTTGRSASQWIDTFLIGEARNLLSTTDMSIAEISDRLGFPNQSFFGKYFKFRVGKSPLSYRQNKE